MANAQQATNPMPSQTKTVETPVTLDMWQTLMEQLSKENEDDKLLKRHIRRKLSKIRY